MTKVYSLLIVLQVFGIFNGFVIAQENRADFPARAQRVIGRRTSSTEVPDNVQLVTDIAYRDGNDKWRLELAMPKTSGKALRPGLVIVHGGGWRSGEKARGPWRSLPLEYAAGGYVCISVNYRLTDEAPFPACVEDCKCAVRWLRAHAKQYQVDPTRIGGYGNSAGAHLVAMLGLAGPDAGWEGDGPYQHFGNSPTKPNASTNTQLVA